MSKDTSIMKSMSGSLSNSALLGTRWIVYRDKLDDAKSMQNKPNFNVDLRENGKSLGSEFHLMRKARLSSFQRHPNYGVNVTVQWETMHYLQAVKLQWHLKHTFFVLAYGHSNVEQVLRFVSQNEFSKQKSVVRLTTLLQHKVNLQISVKSVQVT